MKLRNPYLKIKFSQCVIKQTPKLYLCRCQQPFAFWVDFAFAFKSCQMTSRRLFRPTTRGSVETVASNRRSPVSVSYVGTSFALARSAAKETCRGWRPTRGNFPSMRARAREDLRCTSAHLTAKSIWWRTNAALIGSHLTWTSSEKRSVQIRRDGRISTSTRGRGLTTSMRS